MRRRLAVVLTALALTLSGSAPGPGPRDARAETAAVSCTDWCGEKAAENCERIESWRCSLYIAGCLAGCNVKKLTG
ncbi:MAG: hypothetical protein R6X22_11365 [Gemmatimonadota bacterium]|jgi:hypothetical protein